MAQNKDLRKQTSVPTTPADADKVVLYANASGQLNIVNSNGTVTSAAGAFSQNISQAAGTITTGVLLRAQSVALGNISGAFYGTTGSSALGNSVPIFLGVPNQWLVAVGSSGQKLVIPAYTYT